MSEVGEVRWQPIETAPKGVTVKVKLKSGRSLQAHFAQDLSGEEQPPFKGWFKERSKAHPEYGYIQIDDPIHWMPLPDPLVESQGT